MLSNMASSLILNKRIFTTVAKAKALRSYIEPLLTKSKEDTTHSRRIVFSYLQDKKAVTELFRDVAQKIADRPGGYTRILKAGMRIGDNADMCYMELVDYNELMLESADKKDKKGGRKRRGTKKAGKQETAQTVVSKEITKTEETTEDQDVSADISDETTDAKISSEEQVPENEEAVSESDPVTEAEPEVAEPVEDQAVIDATTDEDPGKDENIKENDEKKDQ